MLIQLPQELRRTPTPPLVPSSSPEEPQRPSTLMPSFGRTAPPSPATIVARHHPKASKIGSPRRFDVVGENLIKNQGLK
jgi:hypothetical protein